MDHAVEEGFIFNEHRNSIARDSDPEKLLEAMAKYDHPHDAVKRWLREE
jgi:predicted Rossmann-fold nucleotide-binding protein